MIHRFDSLAVAGLLSMVLTGPLALAETAAAAAGDDATPSVLVGNEIPDSSEYSGLSRKVLAYSEAFSDLIAKTKDKELTPADWQPLEALVDPESFQREGVFLGPEAEVIDWQIYKNYISSYGAATTWEGTLRRITEVPGLVILELEERNTVNGVTDVANTVTIYEFNDAGKITHLDVYVMPLP